MSGRGCQAATGPFPDATSRGKRGQAAVEVLAYAGFFFMVFVAAVSIFLQVQNQELSRAEHSYAQEIAYGFADSIHTAFVAGPGFVETVNVPKDILGKRYWLLVSYSKDASAGTGYVYVDWLSGGKNESFSAPTVTASYSPTVSGFVNTTTSGQSKFIVIDTSQNHPVRIGNDGGNITIAQG